MEVEFNELVGKTLTKIKQTDDQLLFICSDSTEYLMCHDQDCCEQVLIEDIAGNLDDLIGSPILKASEDTDRKNKRDPENDYPDSFTWTFYNLATIKGYVTIRWYGTSNGYYSENVSFKKIEHE